MITLALPLGEYEALASLAARGASSPDEKRALDTFLRAIETRAGLVRDLLWIQWHDADAPLPPGTTFPETWPESQRYRLELVTRRIARSDVDDVLRLHAHAPSLVLVTPDPGAVLGWTRVEDYFA